MKTTEIMSIFVGGKKIAEAFNPSEVTDSESPMYEKTVIFATYIGKRKNKYRFTSARHTIAITSDTPLELEKGETYQMNINYTR